MKKLYFTPEEKRAAINLRRSLNPRTPEADRAYRAKRKAVPDADIVRAQSGGSEQYFHLRLAHFQMKQAEVARLGMAGNGKPERPKVIHIRTTPIDIG